MELNSGIYKDQQDFDTINYNQKIISLNDDILINIMDTDNQESTLDPNIVKYRGRLWDDIKKVCGGIITVDYLIMYQHVYLGESYRKISERFGVTHMAIYKRFNKIIQKLQFLYGVGGNKIPYYRREGNKL